MRLYELECGSAAAEMLLILKLINFNYSILNAGNAVTNCRLAAGTVMQLLRLVLQKSQQCQSKNAQPSCRVGQVLANLMDLVDLRMSAFQRQYFGASALKILHDCLKIPSWARRMLESTTFFTGDSRNENPWCRLLQLTFEMFSNPTDGTDKILNNDFNNRIVTTHSYSLL